MGRVVSLKWFLVLVGVGGVLILSYLFLMEAQVDQRTQYKVDVKILNNSKVKIVNNGHVDKNYLDNNVARLTHLPLLINTSACKIPDFDPWDPEVASLYAPPPPDKKNCAKTLKWSTIDHSSELVFNQDRMSLDGYPFSDLSCCYMTLKRKPEPGVFTPPFHLESRCIAITMPRTPISREFIVVNCSLQEEIVLTTFHALLPLVPRLELRKPLPPLEMEVLPPNVIILGFDSTSRLNFRRFMTKTIQTLESLRSVEMMGYNKVGERTYPNMASHLLGYLRLDAQKLCFANQTYFDENCPLIWRHFEEAGYLTAHVEDGNTFPWLGGGFEQVPLDFYLRPLSLPGLEYLDPSCYYQTVTKIMLEYVEASLTFARTQKRPLFAYTFAAYVTHDDVTGLSSLDDMYASTLQRLQSQGHLDNSILLVLGDHGVTYGPTRQTMVGFFESKLPPMWIYLPERIRQARPDWEEALSHNSAQLTSSYAYAVYWSLHLILKTFGPEGSYREPEDAENLATGEILKRHPTRQTFFERASSSSFCDQLGIPPEFCACVQLLEIEPLDASLIPEAAQLAVEHINTVEIDPDKCAALSLVSLQGAAVIKAEDPKKKKQFILTFATTPGGALFEAGVTYSTQTKTFEPSTVTTLRMDGMTMGDVACLKDAFAAFFCYCKR